ncbi:ulp1 protease family, C-terminal catalytic domain-containing protein [Artemisia annua]|uniref:Ulp1 protease family, C-terminal catalytic domain-containing protein n=1 Tax=Artemisia annua TaxID=35608 RepID=A0A2U1NG64_ARTAN|nr:ulp1 protease family, C-terminal catalytic domain-containing protein [Artemisia annua]
MKIINSITVLADSLKSQEPSEIDPPKDDNKNTVTASTSSATQSSSLDVPLQLPQPPIPQENNNENTASRTITIWSKEHEITVLTCILEYFVANRKYPFVDNENMQQFYQEWIEWRGVYVDEDVFFNKMVELPERYHLQKQMVISGQNMERQWMYGMSLNDPEFVKGVESFLIAVESNQVAKGDIEIFCPCSKCKNFKPFTDIKTIEWHLHRYGFVRKYTCWSEHGESLVGNSTSSHLEQVALQPVTSYTAPQMQSQLATVEPVKPKTQEERYKERLDKLEDRPKLFKESARRFTKCKNRNIPIDAPHNMYVKPWGEWIEYEAVLDIHIEAKVDITFIHWWAICVFLNPHLIVSGECLSNSEQVVDHIISTKGNNPGKDIYVATYLQGGSHWLLFVVCPNLRRGYIVDSSKRDNTEKNYYSPKIVESYSLAFQYRAFEIKFDWTMAKCFQQKGDWECGYYLMKSMYDLALYKQADFPKHVLELENEYYGSGWLQVLEPGN